MAALSTLVDTFDDNITGAAWSASYGGVSEVGGRARVPCSSVSYAGYQTGTIYSFDRLSAQIPTFPTKGTAAFECYSSVWVFSAGQDPGSHVGFLGDHMANTLSFMIRTGYVDTGAVTVTLDRTQHAWWRLTLTGSTLTWETAPDGMTWTVQRTATAPAWLPSASDCKVLMESHRDSGTDDYTEFDNFNITISSATATMPATGTLTSTATRSAVTAGTVTASAGLAAAGTRSATATASMPATANLGGSAAVSASAAGTLAGASGVNGNATRTASAISALAGAGQLTATGAIVGSPGTGSLDAVGALSGSGQLSAAGVGSLAALGALTATASATKPTGTVAAGTGALTTDAVLTAAATAMLAAGGAVAGTVAYTAVGAASLGGTAQISADATVSLAATAVLDGAGSLSAAVPTIRRPGTHTAGSLRPRLTAGAARGLT